MPRSETANLHDALAQYLGNLRAKNQDSGAPQELNRFVSWFGADRDILGIHPPEVGDYGEYAAKAGSTADAAARLQEVRKFLTFAKKEGLIEQNLARHIRVPKGKSRTQASETTRRVIELTRDGHSRLVQDVEKLRAERGPIAAEIKRAAADKDVRENAPLEAAREQLGHLESRIAEIESTLKVAVIVRGQGNKPAQAIGVGAKVTLRDMDSNRETKYTLVSAAEANPLEQKISDASPVGKALLGRRTEDEIEVDTPRGKLRYRVGKVTS